MFLVFVILVAFLHGLTHSSSASFNFIHIIRFTVILLFFVSFLTRTEASVAPRINWNENWTSFIYDNFMLMIIIKLIWYLKYIHNNFATASDVILSTWCHAHYYDNLFRWRYITNYYLISMLLFFEISCDKKSF